MFSSNTTQVSNAVTYIEDVFSTYVYTGNGATQTITNGVDLATKGGLVWFKARNAADPSALVDTVRGTRYTLASSSSAAQVDQGADTITGLTNGFSLNGGYSNINSVRNFVSWTFAEQPKFFDVVTWTGNGANRAISHNLGSTPACIIVKQTNTARSWVVYHTSLGASQYLVLNGTNATATDTGLWWNSSPTSTQFYVGSNVEVNASGGSYVAYIFAHNAGGFGLTGTDNVISCGSFTTDIDAYVSVELGYEPQWILYKPTSTVGDWRITDNMRSWTQTGYSRLFPNLTNAESSGNGFYITSTGFKTDTTNFALLDSQDYIYIAIRRGPMKVPTGGTSVYYTDTSRSAVSGSTPSWVSGFVTDMAFGKIVGNVANMNIASRLTGTGQLFTNTTSAEGTDATYTWDFMQGWGSAGSASSTFASWMFGRAPSFFDVVCYTGDGVLTGRQVNHNLGVAPELIILKARSNVTNWTCYAAPLTASGRLLLNSNAAVNTTTPALYWGNGTNTVAPTSTVFTLGSDATAINQSGSTYVAYLFATCPGVSKVGSYTGTGATQTISCGFTGGARFVMVKRTDSTGDWYVWDTARGMVSGTDPSLLLNSTAAEVNANSIYTTTGGFQIVSTAAGINASGGTYIFLAIA